MTDQSNAGRGPVDWKRAEAMYRTGAMYVREIAAQAGVSHTAINKRAEKHGWARDLKAKIKAKADSLVARVLVASEVSAETKATEAVVVEVEAQVRARIRLAHRADIGRSRALVMKLLAELEAQTADVPALHTLGDLMRAGDGPDKLNELYQRIVSLPGRIKSMKEIADSLRILIDKEREAFGIESGPEGNKPEQPFADVLAAFISKLHESGSRLPIAPPKAIPASGALKAIGGGA